MKQQAIWDYFQGEGDSSFDGSVTRLSYLATLLPTYGSVLNIGVGGGHLERILAQRGNLVYCLDPSEVAIKKIGEELALGSRAKIGFSQDMPFADSIFDGVVMSEVLEHLSTEVLEATLEEVHRVLKSGGVFVGTVPANEILAEQDVVCPHCAERFHRWGHVQSFSPQSLTKLLSAHFSVETLKIKAFSSRPPGGIKGAVAAVARTGLYHLRFGPYAKNANIVFVVRH